MLFKISALLALAASVSAAAVPRDSNMGSWDAYVDVREDGHQYFHAEFTSDSYPDSLRTTCILDPTQDPVFKRCDKTWLDWSFDGTTFKISQGVEKPNPMTVFGEAEVEVTEDLGDGRTHYSAKIDVTRATA